MNSDIPTIQPWKRIAFDPFYGGSWVVAGDVDGDGDVEIVTARNINENDIHFTCTVAAYKLDGRKLWHWGGPGAGRAELHHDVACQIHDWDGDGCNEVVVCDKSDLVELDGATGHERRRLPLPNRGITDCVIFCNLSGGKRATDVLVKSRYTQVFAFDRDWNQLWLSDHPGGCRTAHQPWVADLDHDGRDEVLVGAVLLNGDGSERWRIGLDRAVLELGHLDCCRLLKDAGRPEDVRLAFTYCGSLLVGVMDGTGRVIWTREKEHFESVDTGRVMPGEPDAQVVVDIDKEGTGRSPLLVFSHDGRLLSRFNTRGSRHHDLVHWRAGGVADIVVGIEGVIYSGAGEAVAKLATDPVDQVLNACACDLTGDGYQDLLVSTRYGTAAYLFRNPRSCQAQTGLPLGSGMNYTLY